MKAEALLAGRRSTATFLRLQPFSYELHGDYSRARLSCPTLACLYAEIERNNGTFSGKRRGRSASTPSA